MQIFDISVRSNVLSVRARGPRRSGFVSALLALFIVIILFADALAAPYVFVKVADSSGEFQDFSAPSINASGTVAFIGNFKSGVSGIYTVEGGVMKTIADTSGPFSLFDGTPSIDPAGTVAFLGSRDDGGRSISVGNGGALTTIADTAGPFRDFSGSPSINASGTVVFVGYRDAVDGTGIYASSGGTLTTIVETYDGRRLSYFGAPAINTAGTVAFLATRDNLSRTGVYTSDGGLVTTISEELAPYDLSINSEGTVAFAGGDTSTGIFVGNGGPTVKIADTTGPFARFYSPAINASGAVTFFANLDDSFAEGIYTGADPGADSVIKAGDTLFGSTVSGVGYSKRGMNDSGQVAFVYGLTDHTTGIAIAIPVPEPSMCALLVWSSLVAGASRRKRGSQPETTGNDFLTVASGHDMRPATAQSPADR